MPGREALEIAFRAFVFGTPAYKEVSKMKKLISLAVMFALVYGAFVVSAMASCEAK